jgi:hypothetical protein
MFENTSDFEFEASTGKKKAVAKAKKAGEGAGAVEVGSIQGKLFFLLFIFNIFS